MLQVIKINHCFSDLYSHSSDSSLPLIVKQNPQKQDSSLSPEESKQKSQLCRRFMEYGYCPYQKKCKFAHGSHELLRNNQLNSKYKTKLCDNYRKNFYCIYGNRCNFIHEKLNEKTRSIDSNDIVMKLIRKSNKNASALLSLLV